jgi:hypothetical protein
MPGAARRAPARRAAPVVPGPTSAPADPFLRLTPHEVALSAPLGAMTTSIPPVGSTARVAFERAVLPALRSGACHVLFSGGRDSSFVLAVATAVARREDLPLPVPVTAQYPDQPESDESEWQALVLRHLGIEEQIVVTVHDERSFLSATCRDSLARRGLLWPAAVQSQPVLFKDLPSGAHVLTGEGGDGILAPARGTPWHLLAASRRRPSRALLRAAVESLEPHRAHAARLLRDEGFGRATAWLATPARVELARDSAIARGPLRWDRSKRHLLTLRTTHLALHNTSAGAAESGLTMSHPIADPGFVAALAADGGARGFRGRTDTFRRLAADLLPDVVLARTTKARFNASRWSDTERDFARDWDGSGVDPELVDVEVLRREWLSESPVPTSKFLLHAAWCARTGAAA